MQLKHYMYNIYIYQSLSLRSGSLSNILSVINIFLSNDKKFLQDESEYWKNQLIEFITTILSINVGDCSTINIIQNAIFKTDLCSNGIQIENHGRIVKCVNENKHVYNNIIIVCIN